MALALSEPWASRLRAIRRERLAGR